MVTVERHSYLYYNGYRMLYSTYDVNVFDDTVYLVKDECGARLRDGCSEPVGLGEEGDSVSSLIEELLRVVEEVISKVSSGGCVIQSELLVADVEDLQVNIRGPEEVVHVMKRDEFVVPHHLKKVADEVEEVMEDLHWLTIKAYRDLVD